MYPFLLFSMVATVSIFNNFRYSTILLSSNIEDNALKQGVDKYGIGKWKEIVEDSEFGKKLSQRTNVNLKDRWQTLNGAILKTMH